MIPTSDFDARAVLPLGQGAVDILILSNGPGEVTTWVRPVVQALRRQLGGDRTQVRISLVLSPCPNASGHEVAVARAYPEIDRIQGAQHFFPFLLWGKTAEQWDWRDRGVIVFLGGDQIFPVIIGKRLSYSTLIYAEWDARWHRWVDRFAVMQPAVMQQVRPKFAHKFTVVGDLMCEVGAAPLNATASRNTPSPLIGFLPGSKPAKLAQGMPLMLATVQHLHRLNPRLQFMLPVAPTLDVSTLARYADPQHNPISQFFGSPKAVLAKEGERHWLQADDGFQVELCTDAPAYDRLRDCALCLTTVGANTAELAALGVPMLVLLPTQQLDAMRAWDGIPGLLVRLPGIGALFARLVNAWFLRKKRLLAWPNIWAGREIVPELVGHLEPGAIAQTVLELLNHPTALADMRQQMRQIRGKSGAAAAIAALVQDLLTDSAHGPPQN